MATKKRKPSLVRKDEPAQRTRKGLEIPVPERNRFFTELGRTVRKQAAKSSGRETTSH